MIRAVRWRWIGPARGSPLDVALRVGRRTAYGLRWILGYTLTPPIPVARVLKPRLGSPPGGVLLPCARHAGVMVPDAAPPNGGGHSYEISGARTAHCIFCHRIGRRAGLRDQSPQQRRQAASRGAAKMRPLARTENRWPAQRRPGRRRKAALPATLLARLQSDRAALRQAQGPAAQGC